MSKTKEVQIRLNEGHHIAEMEILEVICKEKSGRSPRSDGITYQFYKEFRK